MASNVQIDAALLARLRRRDPGALADAVRDHARPLFRAAVGMGLRKEEAEDMVQNVFLVFLETLGRFEGRSQIRTWLFGILHKKIWEFRREQAAGDRLDPIDEVFESRFDARGNWVRPPQDLDRLLESREAAERIRTCLEGLPHQQREVFVLREMEGLETRAICKILEISVTNFGVLMHRARTRLRECLEAFGWKRS